MVLICKIQTKPPALIQAKGQNIKLNRLCLPCGLFQPLEHTASVTQSTSLSSSLMVPPVPVPATAEHDSKAGCESAKDDTWDKEVNNEDPVGGIEVEHDGKVGRKGAKDGTLDKGDDGHGHSHRTDGTTSNNVLTMATTSGDLTE